ncbi:carbohydrate-binding module family 21 [Purpureocillium lavendulum]|uniref:Carbohydrate-binding module family 21 n=1 Tax=Purpureocillium lavendulum TaxID=1247861 RepID=A0AB34G2B3_9HYPO|nr:carbohydrate-binding module family 21 [Purpureocillium lavendulum]
MSVLEEETDEHRTERPQMVRKKQGELVPPALRSPLRGRPSSIIPGSPILSKAVHFDSNLEHVRHFMSPGASPSDSCDDDVEFPLAENSRQNVQKPPDEWKILMPNFPDNSAGRESLPVRLEQLLLLNTQKHLVGSISVAKSVFPEAVVCRFTFDYWKTTSEAAGRSMYYGQTTLGETLFDRDRFGFAINLGDIAELEFKTLFLDVGYTANGQDYWDNNNASHFQVDFRRRRLPIKGKNHFQRTTSQPANVLPRSTRRNGNANIPRHEAKEKPDDFNGVDERFDSDLSLDQAIREHLGVSNDLASGNDDSPSKPLTCSQPLDQSDKVLSEESTVNSNDHLEMITEASDFSSEAPLTEPSSAPWSDKAGTTEPSSLSYGADMDSEYTADAKPLMNFYNYATLEFDKDLQEGDDVQSITSITDDIGSLAESTSTLVRHREAAINYFVKKFTDDPELLALYQDAAERMNEARFVRNHRRLLKRYFLDLRSEGHTPSEKLAVKFLQLRSDRTRISSEICRVAKSSDSTVREQVNIMLDQAKDKLFLLDRFLGQQVSAAGAKGVIESRATKDVDVTSEASEDSDAGESETGMDGRLPKLDATAEFLTMGRPFSVYKQNLRGFLQLGIHEPEAKPAT